MCFPLVVTCYQKEFLFGASTMTFFWIPYLWTKRHFYKNLFEIPAFSDFMLKFSKFSSSAASFVLVWRRKFSFQYWSRNLTRYLRRCGACLNFAPFWGSLRESTCRYPTLLTTPLEKVVKQSIIQVGTQYRLAKLLRKLPALLLYSFLVLGNGKSFILNFFRWNPRKSLTSLIQNGSPKSIFRPNRWRTTCRQNCHGSKWILAIKIWNFGRRRFLSFLPVKQTPFLKLFLRHSHPLADLILWFATVPKGARTIWFTFHSSKMRIFNRIFITNVFK